MNTETKYIATTLTAEQARKLTDEARNNMTTDVLEMIEQNANKKEEKCEYWTGVTSKENTEIITITTDSLIALGYKVEQKYSDANKEWKLLINW